ncbi:MAG: hypothetical protein ACOCX2_02695 [Armatimonadota bacterium]
MFRRTKVPEYAAANYAGDIASDLRQGASYVARADHSGASGDGEA